MSVVANIVRVPQFLKKITVRPVGLSRAPDGQLDKYDVAAVPRSLNRAATFSFFRHQQEATVPEASNGNGPMTTP